MSNKIILVVIFLCIFSGCLESQEETYNEYTYQVISVSDSKGFFDKPDILISTIIQS